MPHPDESIAPEWAEVPVMNTLGELFKPKNIPISEETGQEILRKLGDLERKINFALGGHALIGGRFIDLSQIVSKK